MLVGGLLVPVHEARVVGEREPARPRDHCAHPPTVLAVHCGHRAHPGGHGPALPAGVPGRCGLAWDLAPLDEPGPVCEDRRASRPMEW